MTESVVIVPPLDIKGLADKTAEYVASVGSSFESKLYAKEKNNPKFQFLLPSSPYHAYYKQQIEAFKSGKVIQQSKETVAEEDATVASNVVADEDNDVMSESGVSFASPVEMAVPEDLHFVLEYPVSLTAHTLDVMRLVAQHAALNGPSFVQALLNRERGNAMFNFLESSHPQYPFFALLLQQYDRITQANRQEEASKLLNETRAAIVDRVVKRVNWERTERAKKARSQASSGHQDEVEPMQVDWDDFVVIQTINFDEDTNLLPPPLTLQQVKAMTELAETQAAKPSTTPAVAAAVVVEKDEEDGGGVVAMDTKPDDEVIAAPARPLPDAVASRIVQAYVPGGSSGPSQVSSSSLMTQKCPICGQQIPIAEMDQHMKIETMSRKHIDHLKELSQGKRSAMAPDDEIAANIVAFSKVRTDIFDTGSEAPDALLQKKRKLDKETKEKHVAAWDGTSASAAQKFSLEQQIATIKATKGTDVEHDKAAIGPAAPAHRGGSSSNTSFSSAPPVFSSAPPVVSVPNIATPYIPTVQPPLVDSMVVAPPPGAARTSLVPEALWIAQNPGPIKLKIAVVSEEPTEKTKAWKLDGRIVEVEVACQTMVEQLKQRMESEIGLPINLQKLKHAAKGFLKDKESCAYYNLVSGDVLELTRQQRGGKKK